MEQKQRLITDNSDDNNEKYMENEFNSDDELTLKKARTLYHANSY